MLVCMQRGVTHKPFQLEKLAQTFSYPEAECFYSSTRVPALYASSVVVYDRLTGLLALRNPFALRHWFQALKIYSQCRECCETGCYCIWAKIGQSLRCAICNSSPFLLHARGILLGYRELGIGLHLTYLARIG